MSDVENNDVLVDARRLLCPLPVIRLQQAIKSLPSGSVVRVTATDPGVQNDIPAWCRVHKKTLLSMEQVANEFIVRVLVP